MPWYRMKTSLMNANLLPVRTVSSKAVDNFRIEGKESAILHTMKYGRA